MNRSILVIAPLLPLPADFGGAIRSFHLIRELARAHEVMLVAPATRAELPAIAELGKICDVTAVPARVTPRHRPAYAKRAAQARSILSHRSFLESVTWNAQFQSVIDRLFATRRVDLVQYEFTQMALYRPSRPCPTVIDAHNIEHELLQRVAAGHLSTIASHLKRLEARKVRRLEQRLWATASTCVATSERDAGVITPHSPTPPIVVPNGVDTLAFAHSAAVSRRRHHVVFTGVMRHQPNIDGVRWYVEQVHPLVRRTLPDATVSIVGADPPRSVQRLASSSVTVTGRVDDVRPHLHAASAAVVPLFAGGGTRLKIVESFAAGIPVVSTPLGAEGLEVREGVDILLANDPRTFASHVVALLTDEELAGRIAESALQNAVSRHDWSIVAQKLLQAHEQAIGSFAR